MQWERIQEIDIQKLSCLGHDSGRQGINVDVFFSQVQTSDLFSFLFPNISSVILIYIFFLCWKIIMAWLNKHKYSQYHSRWNADSAAFAAHAYLFCQLHNGWARNTNLFRLYNLLLISTPTLSLNAVLYKGPISQLTAWVPSAWLFRSSCYHWQQM